MDADRGFVDARRGEVDVGAEALRAGAAGLALFDKAHAGCVPALQAGGHRRVAAIGDAGVSDIVVAAVVSDDQRRAIVEQVVDRRQARTEAEQRLQPHALGVVQHADVKARMPGTMVSQRASVNLSCTNRPRFSACAVVV